MARCNLLTAVSSEIAFYYSTVIFLFVFFNSFLLCVSGYQKKGKAGQQPSSLCLIKYVVSTLKYLFLFWLTVGF